jgi:hypothetical protein
MPQLIHHWYWARAEVGGFDGAYMRFTGQVTVERIGAGTDHEVVTGPALWELMYFGKTNSGPREVAS